MFEKSEKILYQNRAEGIMVSVIPSSLGGVCLIVEDILRGDKFELPFDEMGRLSTINKYSKKKYPYSSVREDVTKEFRRKYNKVTRILLDLSLIHI